MVSLVCLIHILTSFCPLGIMSIKRGTDKENFLNFGTLPESEEQKEGETRTSAKPTTIFFSITEFEFFFCNNLSNLRLILKHTDPKSVLEFL